MKDKDFGNDFLDLADSDNDDNTINNNLKNIQFNNSYNKARIPYESKENKSNLINKAKLPMTSRNPYIRQSKPIMSSYNKKNIFLPNNIMNLVSFFNSFSPNNNINIPSLNTLTKLKSVNNFVQSLNSNYNDIDSIPNYLSNKKYGNDIMKKYYENYNALNNDEIMDKINNQEVIEKTAFGEFSPIQPDNKIYRSQPQNVKYKMDNGINNIYMSSDNNNELTFNNKKQNNTCINNYTGKLVDYNNFKINESNPEVKIVQFNNVIVRSNKSYIGPRKDNKINKSSNNYY